MTPSMTEARRRALLAASRVTLSLSVLGCKSGPATRTVPDFHETISAVAGDLNGPALACGLPARPPHSKERIECCEARVLALAPATPAETYTVPSETPVEIDAATLACCQAFITASDTNLSRTLDWREHSKARSACCHSLSSVKLPFRGPTCTPWGPPMPPAMPAWISDEKGFA